MTGEWASARGILKRGYGVAGGPSADYPYGALDRQIPIFKTGGLDLTPFFRGTLNIDIRPLMFHMIKPEFTFRDVDWTDLHPPENFSFSQCRVSFRGATYAGWVYYPHPETKRRNFQEPSLLEIITVRVPDIKPGDEIQVMVNPDRITLEPCPAPD
jgi:hypothetical protein